MLNIKSVHLAFILIKKTKIAVMLNVFNVEKNFAFIVDVRINQQYGMDVIITNLFANCIVSVR